MTTEAMGVDSKLANAGAVTCVLLAAGEGKRMRSDVSKVLFRAAGRALLSFPLLAVQGIGVPKAVVVVSPKNREAIAETLAAEGLALELELAVQERPLGTGNAVAAAVEQLTSAWTLILYGDGPLILQRDLLALAEAAHAGNADLALLTAELDNARGYGRILRSGQQIVGVREERDLQDEQQRAIREVNPGVYLMRTPLLKEALASLQPNNAQGEYYLTDIVAFAAQSGSVVGVAGDSSALLGVNDRAQLLDVEQKLLQRIRERHALAGVTLRGEVWIDDTVTLESDVEVGPNVVLRGRTAIASGTRVDVGCVLSDARVGSRCLLKPYSVVTDSVIHDDVQVGPFAHLRPSSVLEQGAHIGNFVETKNSRIGPGAKANHLAYLGDVDVGSKTNIGAGTIICNYDGFNKWRTTIGEAAFIGSDSQLIAPVVIGNGAYVGTGSTITEDVPDDALALARGRQVNKEGYAVTLRERLGALKR